MDKEDVVPIYNGILLSYKKKDGLMPFAATGTDPGSLILSEVLDTENKCHLYVKSLK